MHYSKNFVALRSVCLLVTSAAGIWIGTTHTALGSTLDADTEVSRGQYLTNILGCGGCHTEGSLLGEQSGPWLAGSRIGIAYAEDHTGEPTAVVFPGNLTSDQTTGLGAWSKQDIVKLLTDGRTHSGEFVNRVMPWSSYQLLKPEDISAIATFLKTVPAVSHKIPEHILPGQVIDEAYVRFGVYLFIPKGAPHPTNKTDPPPCDGTPC